MISLSGELVWHSPEVVLGAFPAVQAHSNHKNPWMPLCPAAPNWFDGEEKFKFFPIKLNCSFVKMTNVNNPSFSENQNILLPVMFIVVAGLFGVTHIVRIPSHKFAADKHLILRLEVARSSSCTQKKRKKSTGVGYTDLLSFVKLKSL